MVKCSFCGKEIKPGTGFMYVRTNGAVLYFCSSKCFKNAFKLKRKPIDVKWTEKHRKLALRAKSSSEKSSKSSKKASKKKGKR